MGTLQQSCIYIYIVYIHVNKRANNYYDLEYINRIFALTGLRIYITVVVKIVVKTLL